MSRDRYVQMGHHGTLMPLDVYNDMIYQGQKRQENQAKRKMWLGCGGLLALAPTACAGLTGAASMLVGAATGDAGTFNFGIMMADTAIVTGGISAALISCGLITRKY